MISATSTFRATVGSMRRRTRTSISRSRKSSSARRTPRSSSQAKTARSRSRASSPLTGSAKPVARQRHRELVRQAASNQGRLHRRARRSRYFGPVDRTAEGRERYRSVRRPTRRRGRQVRRAAMRSIGLPESSPLEQGVELRPPPHEVLVELLRFFTVALREDRIAERAPDLGIGDAFPS